MLRPTACDPLALTGERTVPGVWHESYWFARHEAAYRWALATCADDVRQGLVLEAGSGEGYGTALAAQPSRPAERWDGELAAAVRSVRWDDIEVRGPAEGLDDGSAHALDLGLAARRP